MPRRSPDYLEARRDELLAASQRAFARHGYEGTTIAILEGECGVSRGAIFNYWPTKLAIFLELAERDAQRLTQDAAAAATPAEAFRQMMRMVDQEREWLRVYLEALRVIRRDPELWQRWVERPDRQRARWVEAVARWKAAGSVRADLDAEAALTLLFVLLDGLVLHVAISPDAALGDYDTLPALIAIALESPATG